MRVWDSTAELRYLVLPERPAGTENWSEDALAAIVTRDAMVGVAKVAPPAEGHRMNGIHDMGGMQDLGPIQYEPDEPVFHAALGRRACSRSTSRWARWRKWNIDAGRHQIELIPPADYLRMSYYEKWLDRADAARGERRPGHARRDRKRPPGAGLGQGHAAAARAERVALLQRTGAGARRDVDGRAALPTRASACAPAT